METIFRALADAHRRRILDLLRERDGQTLSDLEAAFPELSRFGVMKHLKVLEDALLVTAHKSGRFKHHYLNPVPIQELADRWISRFAAPHARGLADLKRELERNAPMTSPKQVYKTIIRTTPEALWQPLTDPDLTRKYYYHAAVESELKPGGAFNYRTPDDQPMISGEVIEADPPRRLVTTFAGHWHPDMAGDPPSRVTYEIRQVGNAVELTLIHDDFPAENATYAMTAGGWPGILSGLKTLLETGEPLNYDPMAA